VIIYVLAIWFIAAPSGFVVGELFKEHFPDEEVKDFVPWLCAAFPPLSAILAIALIIKENTK